METRRLGRTGHQSTVAILGGAAFGRSNPEETAAGFAHAMDAGVNHLDIAPQYGLAEELVGPHIPAVRDRLFVGCKTLRQETEATTSGCTFVVPASSPHRRRRQPEVVAFIS